MYVRNETGFETFASNPILLLFTIAKGNDLTK